MYKRYTCTNVSCIIQRRRLHKLVKLVSDPFCPYELHLFLYEQIKLLYTNVRLK